MAKLIGTVVLGIALTGCVSQEKYNALKLDRDGLSEQLAKSQSDASSARAEADSYKNQLALLNQNGGNLQGLINNLQQQNAQLQAQNDELNRKYAEAMNRPTGGTALPAPLSNELQAFANANPDLVDFDAAHGIVKFKSDVTFASGSAEVTPKAKEAITKFAQILNSPAANGYELLVAGHTDNTRVVNPNTIKQGHLDNWYLSSHRAITVAAELRKDSINPQRLGCVGYADQRPVASNNTSTGQAQNRRVEVLILPTTVRGGAVASNEGGRGATKKEKAPAMNKDSSVQTDSRPVLNK
jgi:chemotaxis protein MotB